MGDKETEQTGVIEITTMEINYGKMYATVLINNGELLSRISIDREFVLACLVI